MLFVLFWSTISGGSHDPLLVLCSRNTLSCGSRIELSQTTGKPSTLTIVTHGQQYIVMVHNERKFGMGNSSRENVINPFKTACMLLSLSALELLSFPLNLDFFYSAGNE